MGGPFTRGDASFSGQYWIIVVDDDKGGISVKDIRVTLRQASSIVS